MQKRVQDISKGKISDTKGPVTRCNFSCNLQRYFTLGRCEIGKYTFPSQFANIFLTYQTFVTTLHLFRVELRCKLPGKLRRTCDRALSAKIILLLVQIT